MTSSTLAILLAQAEHRRDQAVAVQRQADQALSRAVQQHALLIARQRPDQDRWLALCHRSPEMAVPWLQARHAFSRRQHEAIERQAAQVDQDRLTLLQRQTEALDAERRVVRLGRLLHQRAEAERGRQQRQAQRESDEWAARALVSSRFSGHCSSGRVPTIPCHEPDDFLEG
jgi:flagellar FliJ protein